MCAEGKKINAAEAEKANEAAETEKEKKAKYMPDFNVEYTEEDLADYWGDTCSGE